MKLWRGNRRKKKKETEMTIKIPSLGEIKEESDKMPFEVPWGHIYLSLEPKGEAAFRTFGDLIRKRCYDCDRDDSFVCESISCALCTLPCPCRTCEKGRPGGLAICRRNPASVRKELGLDTTPIIWLSSIYGNYNINPEKLGVIEKTVANFIDSIRRSVVLIEGLEYLINVNGFFPVLRMVENINDMAMSHECIVLIPVDERTLDKKELAYLQRNTRSLNKLLNEAGKKY